MSRPWMALYVGDYLADTAHLRAVEHGAYLLLIMHYWRTGGLPDDDGALSRIARLSAAEWRKIRPRIAAFFQEGWKHKRIDLELAEADRISEAGRKGGLASAEARRNQKQTTVERSLDNRSNETSTIGQPSQPHPQPQSQKIPEADASDAGASDPRRRLFNEGLAKLASLTGKGPDACRSFVGKCLKASGDDAITVLGLIEDAERNQVVNPSAWIAARLKPVEMPNGTPEKPGVVAVAKRLAEQFEREQRDGFEGNPDAVLRISQR